MTEKAQLKSQQVYLTVINFIKVFPVLDLQYNLNLIYNIIY